MPAWGSAPGLQHRKYFPTLKAFPKTVSRVFANAFSVEELRSPQPGALPQAEIGERLRRKPVTKSSLSTLTVTVRNYSAESVLILRGGDERTDHASIDFSISGC
jgi:hypothetical protein